MRGDHEKAFAEDFFQVVKQPSVEALNGADWIEGIASNMVDRGWFRPHLQGFGEEALDFLAACKERIIISHVDQDASGGFSLYQKVGGTWHRLRVGSAPEVILTNEQLVFHAPFLVLLNPEN